MPAARASQAVIKNAINAAKECGIAIGAVEIGKDGSVKIIAESVVQGYQTQEPKCEW
ncbi:hypothetical protein [uncultured Sulfitobacter sp.]|uniref:hypothetical protein n=1 Tax=uncultured Sulfitobacter sp. TaxID=191468 RepID=UPI002607A64D|nr:hypothetical protein [uncultured Sulfitobacter sp.]